MSWWWILWAWCCWAAIQIVGSLVVSKAIHFYLDDPCCTLLGIHIPATLYGRLSQSEHDAVVWHERGHWHYKHPWVNLLLLLFFIPHTSEKWHLLKEYQADDYAVRHAGAEALISALETLSYSGMTGAISVHTAKRIARLRRLYLNPGSDLDAKQG